MLKPPRKKVIQILKCDNFLGHPVFEVYKRCQSWVKAPKMNSKCNFHKFCICFVVSFTTAIKFKKLALIFPSHFLFQCGHQRTLIQCHCSELSVYVRKSSFLFIQFECYIQSNNPSLKKFPKRLPLIGLHQQFETVPRQCYGFDQLVIPNKKLYKYVTRIKKCSTKN